MMLRSLRKPSYQFWSSGIAFFLSCHSLMATWIHMTSLGITDVERDFRTHACVGFFFFFVMLTNVCSTTEDIPNEVIFPQNNSSQWIHAYKSPELMKCNESGSHMNSTCVHFSTSIFFHVSQHCPEILFSEWVETVTGYQLVGNQCSN